MVVVLVQRASNNFDFEGIWILIHDMFAITAPYDFIINFWYNNT